MLVIFPASLFNEKILILFVFLFYSPLFFISIEHEYHENATEVCFPLVNLATFSHQAPMKVYSGRGLPHPMRAPSVILFIYLCWLRLDASALDLEKNCLTYSSSLSLSHTRW